MTYLSASEARSKLYRLIDETATSHEPVVISGKRSSAVLVSEEDWRAIQETVHLLSIPSMRESIRKGLKTSLKKCSKDPSW
ncbi:MAG: type II toxin-antitoxin system Phd/YefM family antitoxin [Nitrospiraceae bacterium]